MSAADRLRTRQRTSCHWAAVILLYPLPAAWPRFCRPLLRLHPARPASTESRCQPWRSGSHPCESLTRCSPAGRTAAGSSSAGSGSGGRACSSGHHPARCFPGAGCGALLPAGRCTPPQRRTG